MHTGQAHLSGSVEMGGSGVARKAGGSRSRGGEGGKALLRFRRCSSSSDIRREVGRIVDCGRCLDCASVTSRETGLPEFCVEERDGVGVG